LPSGEVRQRIKELGGKLMTRRAGVTTAMKALPGTAPGHVEQAAAQLGPSRKPDQCPGSRGRPLEACVQLKDNAPLQAA
jgi:hypothetical protein